MDNLKSSKKYEQLEHAGDIRIKVYGETLKELFSNAGGALFDLITDFNKINADSTDYIEVSGTDQEELIVNWLSELNFLFLTESKIFNKFEIEHLSDTELSATVLGEKFNPFRHKLKNEIKAVTFHDLQIVKKSKHWETKIVFDI